MSPINSSERVLKTIADTCDGEVRFAEPLSAHTTWGIGGPADLWLCPSGIDSVLSILNACSRTHVDWTVLGGGSNVLAGDDGYRGVIINLGRMDCETKVSGTTVEICAGRPLRDLDRIADEHSVSGPEFWVGIPGTIGGAVAGNAGAHGAAVCDFAAELHLCTVDGAGWMPMTSIGHSYRRCDLEEGTVVVAARFGFTPDDPDRIAGRRTECIAQRRAGQPSGSRSAGCVFRNPPGENAGALIEAVGLKGYRRGGAEISVKHANFIINRGGATARDVAWLIDEMRRRVNEETGIELETEIRYIGPIDIGVSGNEQ